MTNTASVAAPAGALPRKILRITFANSAGKFIRLATGLFLTPFVLHRLGASDYGLWMLLGSILGYGSLLDFGVTSALIKYVAQYNARDDLASARGLVATALCLYVALGLVAISLSVALAPFFGDWFGIAADARERATLLFYMMGVGAGLAIPSAATSSVLVGLQRFDLLNILGVVTVISSALATVLALLFGGGLVAVVAVSIATPAVMQIPAVLLIRRAAPELRFGLRGADSRLLKQLTSYSSSMFVIDLAGFLLTRTDEIVIAAFFPVAAISPFVVARKLSEVPQMVTGQFLKVVLPLSSDFDARGDRSRLRGLFLSGTRVTLAVSLALGCPLVLLAGSALRLWVGAEYERYAYLLVILGISTVIDLSQWPAGLLLQGTGRHRPYALIAISSALASVVLSIALAPRLGLAGVALGTLLPCAAGSLGFTMPYARRVLDIPWRELAFSSYFPPIAAAMPASFVCWILSHVLSPLQLPQAAGIAMASVVTYAGAYLWIAAAHPECALFRESIYSARTMFQRAVHSTAGMKRS